MNLVAWSSSGRIFLDFQTRERATNIKIVFTSPVRVIAFTSIGHGCIRLEWRSLICCKTERDSEVLGKMMKKMKLHRNVRKQNTQI